MNWPWTTRDATVGKLRRIALNLQSQLEAKDRIISVLQAERDAMAGVIARDRMRVASECAVAARSKAEAEGIENERDRQGSGRGQ